MKHNQKDEKGALHEKQMPRNQQSNSGKMPQHGSNRDHNEGEDHQIGKQGSKKHAEEGKTK